MSTEGGTNTEGLSPKVAVDELIALSDQAVITSKASIDALLAGSSAEPRWGRYPELVVHVEGTPETFPRASYGVVQDPGVYSVEAYDLATILMKGISEGKRTRAELLEYVKTYSGTGLARDYQWDPRGELTSALIWMYKVQ